MSFGLGLVPMPGQYLAKYAARLGVLIGSRCVFVSPSSFRGYCTCTIEHASQDKAKLGFKTLDGQLTKF